MKFNFEAALGLATALVAAALLAPPCVGRQTATGPRVVRPDSTQRELQRILERDLLYREMQELAARGPAAQPSRRPAL